MLTKGGSTMLDIRLIRNSREKLKEKMKNRGESFNLDVIDQVYDLDEKRREYLIYAEELKSRRNKDSEEISKLKKSGRDVSELFDHMKELSMEIKEYDTKLAKFDEDIYYLMLRIPNVPNEAVPDGLLDENNEEIRKWGEPAKFGFEPKAHWDIGANLNILDFERASKVTGSRFAFYKGLGARLERAIINYFLDLHTEEQGYTEMLPPYMVNRKSMTGTGQLPKFEEDAFKITNDDYFLIPTAEVPVTNYYAGEVLKGEDLPIKIAAYSACFRSEAGSAGRDTRGLIRQHQFNKVELVEFSKPEESYSELEKLTKDAEAVLKGLKLPYRVVKICKGDLGYTAALKYDIEVWMPSYNRYVEISSCSNFEAFQARRANIRYKETAKSKPEFVHTLNGSGVAVGRTFAAILENFQREDKAVEIPEVLRAYMGGREFIK